ncbi:MAG: YopX family protein [Christensenellaceae bacterium]
MTTDFIGLSAKCQTSKVIGNIHDNPELLKDK